MYVLLVVVVGYLLGSISFTRIFTRLLAPDRPLSALQLPVEGAVKSYAVTHIGANTASMVLGGKVGCLIGWLDILKGALPTLVTRFLLPEQPYYLLVALACMAGHNWPLYYRFKGGSGISVFYGGLLIIDWLGVLVGAAGGLIGFILLRSYLLLFLTGFLILVPWFWFRTFDWRYLAYVVTANVIFVLGMVPDIQQYQRAQRDGTLTPEMIMKTNPMGRSMLKMNERLEALWPRKRAGD
jgi:acyl phosphate:glycerol-3-phosphate acyltransferase